MTKQQEILKRINICLCQLAEAVENGDRNLGFVQKNTDEIDTLINELSTDESHNEPPFISLSYT